MSTKNVIINQTNATSVPILAEHTVKYQDPIIPDANNYEVAVTSTSIDLRSVPIISFDGAIKSDIQLFSYSHHYSPNKWYYELNAHYVDSMSFTGRDFYSVDEFVVAVNDALMQINGDFGTFTYEENSDGTYSVKYKAPAADVAGKQISTIGFCGELVDLFESFNPNFYKTSFQTDYTVLEMNLLDPELDLEFQPWGAEVEIRTKEDVTGLLYTWSSLMYVTSDLSIVPTMYSHNRVSPAGNNEKILIYLNLLRDMSNFVVFVPQEIKYIDFTNDLPISSISIQVYVTYNSGKRRMVTIPPNGVNNVQLQFRLKK